MIKESQTVNYHWRLMITPAGTMSVWAAHPAPALLVQGQFGSPPAGDTLNVERYNLCDELRSFLNGQCERPEWLSTRMMRVNDTCLKSTVGELTLSAVGPFSGDTLQRLHIGYVLQEEQTETARVARAALIAYLIGKSDSLDIPNLQDSDIP